MTQNLTRRTAGWRVGALEQIEDAVSILIANVAQADSAQLVLVLPPFASPDRPSLGLHVLARVAEAKNWPVAIVYANLSFAKVIGPRFYRELCHSPTQDLVGERIFRSSYGRTRRFGLGSVPDSWEELLNGEAPPFEQVQDVAYQWSQAMGDALADLPAPIIGLSSVFEQTLASLSLLERIKIRYPKKQTLLGGANVDDEMGIALAQFAPEVDHIFQGEAEASLSAFLDMIDSEQTNVPRVLSGTVNTTLDELAPPQYESFFAQFNATIHEDVCEDGLSHTGLQLPYETSRGCWWGAKHHCTFCGLNANGMNHRIKEPEKVFQEVNALANDHGINRILMVDNVMPHSYISTFLPELAKAESKLEIFYEQKANLSLKRMALLEAAGVTSIQPGIESLSTSLLHRMRKGSSAQTNIDCLRYALSAGIHTVWNLLSDFPGDSPEDYEDMIEIIPALHHLQPPGGVSGLSIDRFSPYHSNPEQFGIRDISPLDAYQEVFPGTQDHRLAYHFNGDYDSAIRNQPDLHKRLSELVKLWDEAWANDPVPLLFIFELDSEKHLLIDTRKIAYESSQILNRDEARVILQGTAELTSISRRALDQNQLLHVDGRYLAIACAPLDSMAWDKKI